MYFYLEEDPSPSLHTSKNNKEISFILGSGYIEDAEEDTEKIKKEEKNKNTSYDFVINFTSYNEKQEKKTYSIDTFYGFIVSLFKF